MATMLIDKILFIVTTGSSLHATRAAAQKATWARRVKHLLYVSDTADPALPAVRVPDTANNHFASTKKYTWGLWRLCSDTDHINLDGTVGTQGAPFASLPPRSHFDWIVQADDDTYIYPEHIALALAAFAPSRPQVIGRTLEHAGILYPSGGSGYALSAGAMRVYCENFAPGGVNAGYRDIPLAVPEYSDVSIGQLFNTLNVPRVDLDGWQAGAPDTGPNGYTMYDPVPGNLHRGQPEMRPRLPLSYHYIKPEQMQVLDDDWAPVRAFTMPQTYAERTAAGQKP